MSTLAGDEPELQLGDSSEHVTQLQDRLRGLQMLDKFPDGSYDDATESAVRQLQSDLGLQGDGKVTAETWEALDRHMLDRGLEYNHYAGAGNQHWDTQDAAGGQDSAAAAQHQYGGQQDQYAAQQDPQAAHQDQYAQPEPHWDGQQWLQYDSQSQEWRPMQDAAQAGSAEQAQTGETTPAAEAAPVVPHIDNIHPAIRDDERFSAFHDFLRETHG